MTDHTDTPSAKAIMQCMAILRESCPDLVRAMTEGGCVQFGLAIQALRPDATILYDHSHALVEVDGVTFDVRGRQEPGDHIPIGPEHDRLHWDRCVKLRPKPMTDHTDLIERLRDRAATSPNTVDRDLHERCADALAEADARVAAERERCARIAWNDLQDEASQLQEIRDEYIRSSSTGRIQGRRISEQMAKKYASQFRERSEAVGLAAEHVAAAIRNSEVR